MPLETPPPDPNRNSCGCLCNYMYTLATFVYFHFNINNSSQGGGLHRRVSKCSRTGGLRATGLSSSQDELADLPAQLLEADELATRTPEDCALLLGFSVRSRSCLPF